MDVPQDFRKARDEACHAGHARRKRTINAIPLLHAIEEPKDLLIRVILALLKSFPLFPTTSI
jgi:hypothetical protein